MALYAFDGTNDDARDDGTDAAGLLESTNVWFFYKNYDNQTVRQGITNVYVPGVGTRFGPIGKVIGGAFGAGVLPRIDATYKQLCAAYVSGDQIIDVIGFSRGSAIALDFVNKIAKEGIKQGDTVVARNPAIRFLGIWDLVAAFGVASLGFVFTDVNIGHHLELPASVQHCFHAMALDEKRSSFEVTRVERGYEVWFRGVHSDVGGGNGNKGLNNISLRWMYRKAVASGLPVVPDINDADVKPESSLDPNFFDKLSITWRDIRDTDTVHYTVSPRDKCNKYPATCLVETVDFEQNRLAMGS
jgi:uncharacterized protein (DUF2235 family)